MPLRWYNRDNKSRLIKYTVIRGSNEKVGKYDFKNSDLFLGWVIFISFTPDILTNNQAYMRLWWEFAPFAILILFSVIFISLIEKGKIKIPVASRFFKIL